MEETPFFLANHSLQHLFRLAVRRNYQHLMISKMLFRLTLLKILCILCISLYL